MSRENNLRISRKLPRLQDHRALILSSPSNEHAFTDAALDARSVASNRPPAGGVAPWSATP